MLIYVCHQHTLSLFQVVNSTCTGTNSCLINHKEITESIVARLEVKDFDLYKTMGLFAMPVGCRDATKYLEIAYECIPAGGWYSFNAYFEKIRETIEQFVTPIPHSRYYWKLVCFSFSLFTIEAFTVLAPPVPNLPWQKITASAAQTTPEATTETPPTTGNYTLVFITWSKTFFDIHRKVAQNSYNCWLLVSY